MLECCRTLHIDKVLLLAVCEALLYRWDVCTYRCTAVTLASAVCLCQQFRAKLLDSATEKLLQQMIIYLCGTFSSSHKQNEYLPSVCVTKEMNQHCKQVRNWKHVNVSLLLAVNEIKYSRKLWERIRHNAASCVLILPLWFIMQIREIMC